MSLHQDLCGCGVVGAEPIDCAPDCICQSTVQQVQHREGEQR